MTHTLPARRAVRGFTLVELLIVVTIAGVLASVALPSFADALRRGRRAEAVAALMQLQLAQERWRADHLDYGADLRSLGLPATTPTGLYTLAITEADAEGYVATATVAAGQSGDRSCQVLKLTQAGGRVVYSSIDAAKVESTSGTSRCWNL
ncbi:type IV pilin protein [Ideonella sp. BN130291]|uniref:type IV pilin protein n=1 Tax=Ideonella sp. BN130291 TaxID=3112940 RepID=UPI002E26AEF1|nr:type IV pilin protein [Ideonella sp. BN130291]